MSDPARAIDTSLFDMATSPAEDFYRYVNGGWLDSNPVPPEYSSWGAFHEVNERNQELLHRLLEQAAEKDAPAGTVRRKVGDYFAAAMDEDAIAAAGIGAALGVPGAHRRHRVGLRHPRAEPGPDADRRGRLPLAGHRAGLRGCRRVPRLRGPGRAGIAGARLLHPRRRTLGRSARGVHRARDEPAEQPRTRRRRRRAKRPSRSSPSRRDSPKRHIPPSRCATSSSR